MTNAQMFILIFAPLFMNAIGFLMLSARISDLVSRISAFENSVNSRIDILTGKVAELSDRMARVEERLKMS